MALDTHSLILHLPEDVLSRFRATRWCWTDETDPQRRADLDATLQQIAAVAANIVEGQGNCAPVPLVRAQLDGWVDDDGAPDPQIPEPSCPHCGALLDYTDDVTRAPLCCEDCDLWFGTSYLPGGENWPYEYWPPKGRSSTGPTPPAPSRS